MGVRVECYQGAALQDYIAPLAQLRIQVFREFPYLYDGSLDYEQHYLSTYIHAPSALMVLVFDGEQVVGASSGLALRDEVEEFQRPFVEQGHALDHIFYCGESVLLPAYRGLGLGVRFFAEREAHARRLGGMCWSTFCAVERHADHPLRPAQYQSLDEFWQRRGYQKQPHLQTEFVWQDLHQPAPTAKPMTFWLKALGN